MEKRRKYSREFKIQACELVLKENLRATDVARQLEISETIYQANGWEKPKRIVMVVRQELSDTS